MGWLILFLAANILITGSFLPLYYISAAIFHEAGHLICMRYFGVPVRRIGFVGFGILIEKGAYVPIKKEIWIYLAGPLINLFLSILFFGISLFCDATQIISLALANGCYFLLNILPIPPLDGYHVMEDIIDLRYSFCLSRRIGKGISALFLTLLLVFVIAAGRQGRLNYSLLLVVAALLINETVYFFT